MILEVMGRDGSHCFECRNSWRSRCYFDPRDSIFYKSIADHIEKLRSKGRNHALIVVAEAVKRSGKATVKYVDGEVLEELEIILVMKSIK